METGPIIVLGLILLSGIFIYFLVIKSNNQNKLLNENYNEEKINQKHKKEIKSNLEIEKSEKEIKELEKKIWKQTRIGLFIFLLPHLIFERVLFELYDSSLGGTIVNGYVIGNYLISRWYLKGQIFDRGKTKNILYGLIVSLIVFSIRLILGFIFSLGVS